MYPTRSSLPTTCILFLCHQPTLDQLLFYATFASLGYTVWVIVDDDSWRMPSVSGLVIHQISDLAAIGSGFLGTNPAIRKPLLVSAWDKALFAIHHSTVFYEHYWLIEDDVFVASPHALLEIDRIHPSAHLLTASSTVVTEEDPYSDTPLSWHWLPHIPRHLLPPPWAHGMVCAVRISSQLATEAAKLVQLHARALDRRNRRGIKLASVLVRFRAPRGWVERITRPSYLFIEYLFHTLALHLQLEVITPAQLSTILWRRSWALEDMLPSHLYHPVKDFAVHPQLRERLAKQP